jgi:hypothetical protein
MDLQIEEDCREEELEVFLFQPRAKPPRTKSHSEIMNDANMFLNLFSHHVQCDVNIFRDLVSAKKGFIFKNPSKKQHFKSLGRSTALLKIVNVTSFVTKDTSLGSLDITSFVMKDTILVCLGTLEIDICSFAMKLTILGFLGTAGIATSLAMKHTILGSLGATGFAFLWSFRCLGSLAALNYKHTSATNVNLAARRTRRFPLSIVSRYTCGEEGKESK